MPIKEFELDRRKLILNGSTPYLHLSVRVLEALGATETSIIRIVQDVNSSDVSLQVVKEK